LLRASRSIPLNIAEGHGKGTNADRRWLFEIARGSVMKCATIQDRLTACKLLSTEQDTAGKAMLSRIVSMLIKLGRRNHELREATWSYGNCDYDYDKDKDYDNNNEFQSALKEGRGRPCHFRRFFCK
jgi:four helix bundle protein